MRMIVMAIVFSLLTAAPVFANPYQPMGMMDYDQDMMGTCGMCGMCGMGGMGMMGAGMGMRGMGMGMGRGMGMGMMSCVSMLDLKDEQMQKIRKIQDDLRKEHWALMGKMMDEQSKLRDLWDADTLDSKKIGDAYDAVMKLRKQMLMTKIDAMNKIYGALTKEQKDQLRKLQRGGMGMMGGMGAGHRHGMMDR